MMKNPRILFLLICSLSQGGNALYHRMNKNRSINASLNNVSTIFHSLSLSKPSFITDTTKLRGGACSDSTPSLFGKVASSAAVETFLMYRLLIFGVQLNTFTSSTKRILQAVLTLVVVFGSSYFGQLIDSGMSAATKQVMAPNEIPGDADWYAHLKKPKWNPPGWVFPIMWLIVSKPTQVVAVWKLITNGKEKDLLLPFVVYCAHLSLGDAWNKIFFGLQCIGRGVVVITAFWSVQLLSAFLFYNVDQSAGVFLFPTCAWVTVASALNWSVYFLNREQ